MGHFLAHSGVSHSLIISSGREKWDVCLTYTMIDGTRTHLQGCMTQSVLVWTKLHRVFAWITVGHMSNKITWKQLGDYFMGFPVMIIIIMSSSCGSNMVVGILNKKVLWISQIEFKFLGKKKPQGVLSSCFTQTGSSRRGHLEKRIVLCCSLTSQNMKKGLFTLEQDEE